jgi:ankyrin repeat protein
MLHAALKHAEEIVDMLVANSADLNARDADGRTVLARLAQSGAQDLAGYLRLRGALE